MAIRQKSRMVIVLVASAAPAGLGAACKLDSSESIRQAVRYGPRALFGVGYYIHSLDMLETIPGWCTCMPGHRSRMRSWPPCSKEGCHFYRSY